MSNDYRLERAFDTPEALPAERFNETSDELRLEHLGRIQVSLGAEPTEFARKMRKTLRTQSSDAADTLQ
jgi:hypothetical protein